MFTCVGWKVALCDPIWQVTAKVCEGTNKNMPARNTLVQRLALYTNRESQNAQRHYTETDRQTDGRQDDANSRSYCVAVRSDKNAARQFCNYESINHHLTTVSL